MKIIDLSYEIETSMPTCGTAWHQNVLVEPMGTLDSVGRNTHRIVLGSHSGTHMDAPRHFIDDGLTMEALDVSLMWGDVKVVDFRHKKQGEYVCLDDVSTLEVQERMLFVFGWYHNWKTEAFYDKFPFFSTDAIAYLVEKGMKFIAMDTPSPDDGSAIMQVGESDSPNHVLLLQNQVMIVEYLNNTDVLSADKKYEIIAVPLKIHGSDGSPARVLIKEL